MIRLWLLSFVCGYGATRAAEWIARACAFVSRPNPIVAQHVTPVAYLGGWGVLAGLPIAGVVNAREGLSFTVLVGAVLYTVLGTVDDARPFRPAPKFAWQAVIAAVLVLLGLQAPVTGLWWVDGALSMFAMLVMVNAVNFTDVCDGLVASLGVVTLLAVALLLQGRNPSLWIAGSGACAGFLVRNRPPARIFLGDAGSHLIGFLLAAAWIDPAGMSAGGGGFIAALLVCGVFLFELCFITAVRVKKGLPWWRGSPDHFSLRLQAAGWSRARVDLTAGVISASLAGLAWAVPELGAASALSLYLLAAVLACGYLLRFEVKR
ncbi:glycosyltransferase family 4 protein [Rhizobacter sp. OV335]|uniref:glycosyltransferase family 4 protein n=1 Tax=Rhizobacter sp. OV335 TaxID=1500264 RepID=UPI00090F2B65|nr:MraY family glycosyltransferase [Rhizobacter sp. OV335]SHN29073.1 UDP-GlcNAc:undecaprenyl-phosphate GlcNAc-1-phosphate transferase [Rhizobacter sp. OV335]